jgi:hypothetical protein
MSMAWEQYFGTIASVDVCSYTLTMMSTKHNYFNNLFVAVPEAVLENEKRYQAEADAITKSRKPVPDGDCPCTRGEACQIHGRGN